MDRWLVGWIIDEWIDDLMTGWMNRGCMDGGRASGWVDGWMNLLVDGWCVMMDRLMVGFMDGWWVVDR